MTGQSTVELDPQAREFLDGLIAANVPAIASLTPEQARVRMISLSQVSGLASVARIEDRLIDGPGGPLPLRIYCPEGCSGRPAVSYFHGGGWVTGNHVTHDGLCRQLANALRCVLVAVEYRLAPEHPFPAAVDDAWRAVEWLAMHGQDYGAAAGRVVVAGDSAGGNLAAACTFRARATGRPPLDAQLLLYPVVSQELTSESYQQFSEGYLLTRDAMAWFWNHYVPEAELQRLPEAAPLCQTHFEGLPPAVIVTAGFDPLRDEGRSYAQRLHSAGVPARLLEFPTQIHDFLRRAHLFTAARDAFTQIARALDAAVSGRSHEWPPLDSSWSPP